MPEDKNTKPAMSVSVFDDVFAFYTNNPEQAKDTLTAIHERVTDNQASRFSTNVHMIKFKTSENQSLTADFSTAVGALRTAGKLPNRLRLNTDKALQAAGELIAQANNGEGVLKDYQNLYILRPDESDKDRSMTLIMKP